VTIQPVAGEHPHPRRWRKGAISPSPYCIRLLELHSRRAGRTEGDVWGSKNPVSVENGLHNKRGCQPEKGKGKTQKSTGGRFSRSMTPAQLGWRANKGHAEPWATPLPRKLARSPGIPSKQITLSVRRNKFCGDGETWTPLSLPVKNFRIRKGG